MSKRVSKKNKRQSIKDWIGGGETDLQMHISVGLKLQPGRCDEIRWRRPFPALIWAINVTSLLRGFLLAGGSH